MIGFLYSYESTSLMPIELFLSIKVEIPPRDDPCELRAILNNYVVLRSFYEPIEAKLYFFIPNVFIYGTL